MERQRRFWERQPAVVTTLVVDVLSLLRQVGSAEVRDGGTQAFCAAAWERFLGTIR